MDQAEKCGDILSKDADEFKTQTTKDNQHSKKRRDRERKDRKKKLDQKI